MIMPFIRLVTIYVIVIVAVVAVFKRDQIMELAGWSFDSPSSDQAQPIQTAAATPTAPAQTADPAPTAAPAPAAIQKPTPTPSPTPAATQDVATNTPQPSPVPAVDTPTATTEPEIKRPTATPAPAAASQPDPQKSAPRPQGDVRTRLTEARRAYWSGNLAKSEALFVALAQDAPSNPDITGELGNIFYAQRRFPEAADAYLATGKLLVGNANPAQLLPLIAVLQSIAPQKAETLRALASN